MAAASNTSSVRPLSATRYQPLVIILLAFAAGIVADRYNPLAFSTWWTVAAVSWALWLLVCWRGSERLSACLLLVSISATGAAWHHFHWHLFRSDDAGRYAREHPQPVCVEAVALSGPRHVPAPPPNPLRTIPKSDESQLAVRLTGVRDGVNWRPASGSASLTVDGHMTSVHCGDRLRIFALMSAPAPPENPGEFDFAEQRRTYRTLCQLHCDAPDAVSVIAPGSSWSLRRVLAEVRDRGNTLLWRRIHHQRAGLAAAVLLGAREQLDRERTDSFVTTGTVHLLAISGLHVGILVYFFWLAERAGLLSRRWTLLAAAAFVIAYALLTDARPPVLRATILILIVCAARMMGRRALSFNSLAAAAIVVLTLSPAQLFHTGTQLSFLAVATLSCCAPLLIPTESQDSITRMIVQSRPWPLRVTMNIGGWVGRLWLTSSLIWLVALPLVMYRFHLFSPVAMLLNPLLWIPIAVALFSGFGVLIFGWLPLAGAIFGWICGASLTCIESLIHWGQQLYGSYLWTPGPPLWFVVAFYAGLGVFVAFPKFRPPRRWCVAAFALSLAVALGASYPQSSWSPAGRDRQLACTFLAVGHGTSVVVELPDGRTLLYDAGRMGSPAAPARSIAGFLWTRGITHVDAVIISHADADHYNALPELLERVSAGVVYVSPVMFERDTPALEKLRHSIESAGVPIRELYSGDRLQSGDAVQIEVLHPPRRGVIGSDNANSIVLQIDYAGRRILLPGDLETPGLEDVLAEAPLDCDVIMAPHHGSTRSNPAGFAAWSTPEYVVISGGHGRELDTVKAAFRNAGAEVFHTEEDGAVRVTITPQAMTVRSWRHDPWPP
jgi:competence protein ComEC